MLEKFGEKLKKVREDRNISQKNLGMLLGLSDKAISSYESGRTLPTLETLMKISNELNKSMIYFLDDNFLQESLSDRINEIEMEIHNISNHLKEIKKFLKESEVENKINTPSLSPEV